MNEICCCSFHISTIFTVHLYFAHLCGSCLQLFYSVITVQGTSFFGLLIIIIIIIIIAVGAHKRYKNNYFLFSSPFHKYMCELFTSVHVVAHCNLTLLPCFYTTEHSV